MNSKSRVLQMLSHTTLGNPGQSDAWTGDVPRIEVQESKQALPRAGSLCAAAEPKGKKKWRVKSRFEPDEPAPPQMDPRKIVLEMDLVDKAKLDEVAENLDTTAIASLKNRDSQALDPHD